MDGLGRALGASAAHTRERTMANLNANVSPTPAPTPAAPASSQRNAQASPAHDRNRRRHERRATTDPGWIHGGSDVTSVSMKDVSAGGACFLARRGMTPGRLIKLQVGNQPAWSASEARVIRSIERADGQHEISVQFVDGRNFDLAVRFPGRAGRVIGA